MSKSKSDDAEDPTINFFFFLYKIGTDNFAKALLILSESIEIDRSITNQPKLTVTLLGNKFPRGSRVHQQKHTSSGKIN